MFKNLVSNLSFSPAATGQLTFYWRRLQREQLTRQLSVVCAVMLAFVQVATIIAPPDPATAASPNDIINGGIGRNGHPQATLLAHYDKYPEIKALFTHYGITRKDIDNTRHGKVDANNTSWKSFGRLPHAGKDIPVTIGRHTYYARTLKSVANQRYFPALIGTSSGDKRQFAVLIDCGNLVLKTTTPYVPKAVAIASPPKAINQPKPVPPKPATKPAPTTTTSPTPSVTQPTTVAITQAPVEEQTTTTVTQPVPEGKPNLRLGKTAEIIAADGSRRNANGGTAQPGEVIEYTLTTANTGTAAEKDYVVQEPVEDILEYASITNPDGAQLFNGKLNWLKADIAAGGKLTNTFTATVKNPLPARATSVSDVYSYDLRMDNVYGDVVSTLLQPPTVAKQVEVASATLPETGSGTGTAAVFLLLGLSVYFYSRNRQLIQELSILRGDHHGNGGTR